MTRLNRLTACRRRHSRSGRNERNILEIKDKCPWFMEENIKRSSLQHLARKSKLNKWHYMFALATPQSHPFPVCCVFADPLCACWSEAFIYYSRIILPYLIKEKEFLFRHSLVASPMSPSTRSTNIHRPIIHQSVVPPRSRRAAKDRSPIPILDDATISVCAAGIRTHLVFFRSTIRTVSMLMVRAVSTTAVLMVVMASWSVSVATSSTITSPRDPGVVPSVTPLPLRRMSGFLWVVTLILSWVRFLVIQLLQHEIEPARQE